MEQTQAHPFIIWTLRRTGGTNLTKHLVKLSGLPSTQHEPFNEGRVLGHVTESWNHHRDRSALDASVEEIIRTGVVIKHCVETVPWAINESLAGVAARAGYRHLFLYRRNALDRLLSLHFAQKTGVWGPGMKQVYEASAATGAAELQAEAGSLSGEAIAPLPVEKLLDHERRCVRLLSCCWRTLRASGAKPLALAYEDVYRTNGAGLLVKALAPVLSGLGLRYDETGVRAWAANLVGSGDQGTRDKYRLIPGMEELAEGVQSLAPFSPPPASDVSGSRRNRGYDH
ncbi:MAG: hypothetical protein JXR29_02270 [Methylothermaceae bacterium]|nr:hypothetical protein [Methylothermaceae bacterium]